MLLMYCSYRLFRFWLFVPNLPESHTWITDFGFQQGTQSRWACYFRSLGGLYKKQATQWSPLGPLSEIPRFPGELCWDQFLSDGMNRSSIMHQGMLGGEHVCTPAWTREHPSPGICLMWRIHRRLPWAFRYLWSEVELRCCFFFF